MKIFKKFLYFILFFIISFIFTLILFSNSIILISIKGLCLYQNSINSNEIIALSKLTTFFPGITKGNAIQIENFIIQNDGTNNIKSTIVNWKSNKIDDLIIVSDKEIKSSVLCSRLDSTQAIIFNHNYIRVFNLSTFESTIYEKNNHY